MCNQVDFVNNCNQFTQPNNPITLQFAMRIVRFRIVLDICSDRYSIRIKFISYKIVPKWNDSQHSTSVPICNRFIVLLRHNLKRFLLQNDEIILIFLMPHKKIVSIYVHGWYKHTHAHTHQPNQKTVK